MKLWTIQPTEVYESLQKNGIYTCDEKLCENMPDDFTSFKPSYDWMVSRMKEKIGPPPKDVSYPVWAWHTYDGKRKKPDLRHPHASRGRSLVCLGIEVDDKDVVLSDFDTWHFVLSNFYYSQAQNEEQWDKDQEWFEKLNEKEKKEIREKSWEDIFNIRHIDTEWEIRGEYIQATFWVLKKEQIKEVQHFKSR